MALGQRWPLANAVEPVCSAVKLPFERGGLEALRPSRRGPRQPVAGYPSWIEQVVITVRLLTYWNSKRISAELRRRQIADVGETWIEALFDRFGTARPSLPR